MNTQGRTGELTDTTSRVKPREVETFVVVDFDRCLGDTYELYVLFEEILLSVTNITAEDMRTITSKVEESGGSFSVADYAKIELSRTKHSVDWEEFVDIFIAKARARDDMLMPGAQAFLQELRNKSLPFGILTFGDIEWQRVKLIATQLDYIPLIITDSVKKGYLLASWCRADGKFAIPDVLTPNYSIVASKLVFVDDKATSFDGLPGGCSGFQFIPYGVAAVKSQLGDLPKNAQKIGSLAEVLNFI